MGQTAKRTSDFFGGEELAFFYDRHRGVIVAQSLGDARAAESGPEWGRNRGLRGGSLRYNARPMALVSGTKLGPYEVIAPLGAGGMGEVYRARDARLGRDVAIKILPQHLSSNPQLKERFDREARAISSLNHPRICTLHDVGHQDGTDFLVMELLEGESLADRLRRGPLPLKETLKIGMEVCEALDTAHRARIIHRDLKPGNIMLTKSGAKLMDFGLAKAAIAGMAVDGATAPLLSAARTVSGGVSPLSPLTTAGEVLGTIQYMSPEQLEGKEADARSDIFALGALLYEMTTGKRPFDGKSQISVASAILEKDPEPISAIQPLTPTGLEPSGKNVPGVESGRSISIGARRAAGIEMDCGWFGPRAACSLGCCKASGRDLREDIALGYRGSLSARVHRTVLVWLGKTAGNSLLHGDVSRGHFGSCALFP